MLSQLVKALEEGNGKFNLIKGFKKCGIVAIDVRPLLARSPAPENSTKQNDTVAADQSLINVLTELLGNVKCTKESKRIAVVLGKSVNIKDIENQDRTENQTSIGSSKQPSKKIFQIFQDTIWTNFLIFAVEFRNEKANYRVNYFKC